MNKIFWRIEDPSHFAWYGYLTPLLGSIIPLHRKEYISIHKPEYNGRLKNNTCYLFGDNYE